MSMESRCLSLISHEIQNAFHLKRVLYFSSTAFLTTVYMYGISTTMCTRAVVSCLLVAFSFVGSLYAWRCSYHRDHPSTIKRRFVSVFVTTLLSPIYVYLFALETEPASDRFRDDLTVSKLLGLRSEGIIVASLLPLLLTMILFAGPLLLRTLDGVFFHYLDWQYWSSNCRNLVWLRNHFVAPFSEEFSFRACMLPLLVNCFSAKAAIVICPLFFGVAHVHHLTERLKVGGDVQRALLETLFQFSYTTLFGAYSAFLFLRTGHFLAPFVVHAFCNHMGFPDFGEIFSYPHPKRGIIAGVFVAGLIAWSYLLFPLTDPSLYQNDIFWRPVD